MYAKTCLLLEKTHKSRRKTQNSFVPYLTSACQEATSSKTANWSAPCPMSWSTTPQPDMAFSLKTCWMPRHKVRKAHLIDIDPLWDLRYALRARYVLRIRYALWGERDLYHIESQSNISNLSKGKYIDFAKQKYRQKGEYLWISTTFQLASA